MTINKEIFKKIFKLIKSYDEIVIARHIGPDPDAVASAIALRDSIRLTFPEKRVYAIGAGVSKFRFLGNHDKLDYNSITNALLIVLDVPNMVRIDGIEGLTYKEIIRIDHHPDEDIKSTINCSSILYSSTAEMVVDLLYNTKLVKNADIMGKLYLGIVSDTERFLFSNTNPHTFDIVHNMIKDYNLDITSLYNNLYLKNFDECKFEAYITNNLIINENGLGYINIEPSILKEYNADLSSAASVVNKFNFIKELIVWCFITYDEQHEVYKVNLRSRGPVINEIASHYHGGGHALAAGSRIYEKDDIQKLLKELENACINYKENH